MTDPQTLITKLLEEEGRSQAWLAGKLRISRQTLWAWLHGREATPRPRQAQIAVTLGIKAADYFDTDGLARRS